VVTAPLPPSARSDNARKLTVAAIEGRFLLQRCTDCGAVQYPPAEACHRCIGPDLDWQDVDRAGTLLATTSIYRSVEPYFQARTPCTIGLVRLASGTTVMAHLAPGCVVAENVELSPRLDAAGAGVLVANVGETEQPIRGFSTHDSGACLLETAEPDLAAKTILDALEIADFTDIATTPGKGIAITARHGERSLNVLIRHPMEADT
jgi:uncharacterized OB-fold protein